jgi:hypothetical protein
VEVIVKEQRKVSRSRSAQSGLGIPQQIRSTRPYQTLCVEQIGGQMLVRSRIRKSDLKSHNPLFSSGILISSSLSNLQCDQSIGSIAFKYFIAATTTTHPTPTITSSTCITVVEEMLPQQDHLRGVGTFSSIRPVGKAAPPTRRIGVRTATENRPTPCFFDRPKNICHGITETQQKIIPFDLLNGNTIFIWMSSFTASYTNLCHGFPSKIFCVNALPQCFYIYLRNMALFSRSKLYRTP